MIKILVIGDVHDEVGQDKERFHVLGNYIINEKPDYIIFFVRSE